MQPISHILLGVGCHEYRLDIQDIPGHCICNKGNLIIIDSMIIIIIEYYNILLKSTHINTKTDWRPEVLHPPAQLNPPHDADILLDFRVFDKFL